METHLTKNPIIYENDKDGKPLKTTNGNSYKKISFQCEAHPNKTVWYNCFNQNDTMLNLKAGDTVETDFIEQIPDKNYLVYRKPTEKDRFKQYIDEAFKVINSLATRIVKNEKDIEEIKRAIQILAKEKDPLADHDEHNDEIPVVEDDGEIQISDIPL